MDANASFLSIWRQFQGKEGEDQLPLCAVAAEFLRKIEETIFTPLGDSPSLGQIAQAKYLLQEEWHAWKKSIPARHLRHASDHHRCLAEVYDMCYDRLHLLQLTIRPATNLILTYDDVVNPPPAPSPPPAPPSQIGGIFLGEDDDGK